MKQFLLFAFLFANVNFVFSQSLSQTIYGKIVDKDSNEPLYNAAIFIIGSDPIIGTVTDFDGVYTLENVPVGRHDIQVQYLGYETANFLQILVSSGKSLNLDVSLTESFNAIKEIEVSAIKEGQSTTKVNNEMAVVSARSFSLEQSSRYAGSVTDPSRLVLSFPGVRNQGDVQNGISVRGNSPTGLLWALEGYEIPNPNHFGRDNAQGAVNMITSNLLSNAQFYTAAFPAQYGNATSGVFDIYLRKGNTERHEFSVAAGSIGIEGSAEGPFSKKGKSSYLISGRYSTLAALDKVGYNLAGENVPQFFDINYKFHFPTKKAGTFQLFGIFGNSNLAPTEQSEFDYFNLYRLSFTGLKHQIRVSENGFLKSAILFSSSYSYFTENNRRSQFNRDDKYVGYNDNIVNYPITEQIVQADTKYSLKVSSKHSILMGINVQIPRYNLLYEDRKERYRIDNNTGVLEFRNSEADSTTANISTVRIQSFMQHKYRITERLSFTAGLHFQHLNYNKSFAVEPRGGMTLLYGLGHKFTMGIGLHSRLEALGYYGTTTSFSRSLIGENSFNQFLGPTRSAHFVVGNQFKLASNLSLQIELYYQHLYQIPVDTFQNSFHASINYQYGFYSAPNVNEGIGRNYGMDISLEKTMAKNYYLLFNTSIYSSKYRAFDGVWRNTRYNGNFLVNITAGKDFVIGKEKNNRISLNAKTLWAGNNRIAIVDDNPSEPPIIFGDRYANYFRLDARIAYIRNKEKYSWTLSLDIQNVTNKINEVENPQINAQGLIPFIFYKVDFGTRK